MGGSREAAAVVPCLRSQQTVSCCMRDLFQRSRDAVRVSVGALHWSASASDEKHMARLGMMMQQQIAQL